MHLFSSLSGAAGDDGVGTHGSQGLGRLVPYSSVPSSHNCHSPREIHLRIPQAVPHLSLFLSSTHFWGQSTTLAPPTSVFSWQQARGGEWRVGITLSSWGTETILSMNWSIYQRPQRRLKRRLAVVRHGNSLCVCVCACVCVCVFRVKIRRICTSLLLMLLWIWWTRPLGSLETCMHTCTIMHK